MKRLALALCLFAAVVVAMRVLPLDRTAGPLKLQRLLMGTVWTVEIHGDAAAEAAARAAEAVFAELERIDAVMSEWKPESPISAVNAAAGGAPIEVPEELRALLQRAIHYSEASDGAFDVTWHGMRQIWRFDEGFEVPSAAAVEAARRLVNYRDIRIEGNRVGLARPGMSIGLGGIAKGYALDRAGAVLSAHGFRDFLIDGGGDILVSGSPSGRPWRLGIQDPRAERGELLGAVSLTGGVLITSGDYEQYRTVGGVRYHHIIDPRTGWPAPACQSVTVIGDSAERAVVLAKVIFIHGPERGLDLARADGVETLIVDAAGRRHLTPGFERRFEPTSSDPR